MFSYRKTIDYRFVVFVVFVHVKCLVVYTAGLG